MYQSTKKRANGPKCPVTGKRIQGVCDFLFLNFYSFLVEFGIYLPSTFIYRCDLVLVLGFVELSFSRDGCNWVNICKLQYPYYKNVDLIHFK